MGVPDLAAERVDYLGDHLLESAVPDAPFALFRAWLAEAFAARDRGELAEPTAMVVATCAAGRPRSRTVLLKELSAEGFIFFTNYDSAKGSELAADPLVALHFGWYAMHRQIRIEGAAERVPRAESEAYFATRPRGSQLGAWASAQSSPVASIEELQAEYAAAEARFAGSDVPCPEHWGGFLVRPTMIEFWQGQPSRMHDRLRYQLLAGDQPGRSWDLTRLAP
ncbi:pyridoxine/pyridoxamine 5'-phosphate oxidase [Microlunatus phosphovorus NM-1]|uniref:Pyridoxine/pyridoxamine 5'-phosphate oxidase n=1 Tax=Microlunatus phosphovorus (strain ATCC 700054 / DSM 10555 / JCM 9379 / NBRC 101784 / NCIMB 13414 / VKM Ac-1990 / NM-1) TaxID=1032480 RepID=F5XE79_MICPN|nr:pyridoxamine 5'-phosphate oxidase [Microlunatus phosphovorus]BAK37627.1 pyridoxine/pyridoxamine 5'-phosphate oxidase [Microlunatus phosphovorus NM-1]